MNHSHSKLTELVFWSVEEGNHQYFDPHLTWMRQVYDYHDDDDNQFNCHGSILTVRMIRAGLYHMQTMQLHRAARKKGAKSGAPEELRGRQKWQRGDKIYDFRDHGVRRRTLSRFNLMKTYLSSTMAQDRLSGLSIIAEEKEVGTQSTCNIVV